MNVVLLSQVPISERARLEREAEAARWEGVAQREHFLADTFVQPDDDAFAELRACLEYQPPWALCGGCVALRCVAYRITFTQYCTSSSTCFVCCAADAHTANGQKTSGVCCWSVCRGASISKTIATPSSSASFSSSTSFSRISPLQFSFSIFFSCAVLYCTVHDDYFFRINTVQV